METSNTLHRKLCPEVYANQILMKVRDYIFAKVSSMPAQGMRKKTVSFCWESLQYSAPTNEGCKSFALTYLMEEWSWQTEMHLHSRMHVQ